VGGIGVGGPLEQLFPPILVAHQVIEDDWRKGQAERGT
jgi:hypothetical protein